MDNLVQTQAQIRNHFSSWGGNESITEVSRLASTFKFLRLFTPHITAEWMHFCETRSGWNHVQSSTECYLKKKGKKQHETGWSDRTDSLQTNNTSLWWGIKALLSQRLWWWKAEVVQVSQSSLTTTRPCPDAVNCCVTAHMNTPESAVSLVRSAKVHCSDSQRHTISIACPHGNSNGRCDCMESGVCVNLSHVKTASHYWAEDLEAAMIVWGQHTVLLYGCGLWSE